MQGFVKYAGFCTCFYCDHLLPKTLITAVDVPYIANWIYEHPGLDLNLKGIWIADPSLSYDVVQQEIPALRFAQESDFLQQHRLNSWLSF